MKLKLILTLLLFLPKIAISQISKKDKITFFDSKWKETTSENHSYYRITKDYSSNQDLYEIKEYNKSGTIRTEGHSKNKDNFTKEGEIITYFENGNKHKISQYSNKKLIGKEIEWYENGNKKSEIEYTPEEKESQNKTKIIQYWNKDNLQTIIDGNGSYEESTKEFYATGKLKNGYKDGIWEGWQIKPENRFTEEFKNGKFISGKLTDESNTKTTYTSLVTKSQPIGGFTQFYNNLHKSIKQANISPQKPNNLIIIEFIVDIDGKVTEPKIIRSIDSKADELALAYLSNTNWIPEIKRGQKVRSKYTQPIQFQSPQ